MSKCIIKLSKQPKYPIILNEESTSSRFFTTSFSRSPCTKVYPQLVVIFINSWFKDQICYEECSN